MISRYPIDWTFEQKLDLELARRAINSAFIFSGVAMLELITGFGCDKYLIALRVTAFLIVVANFGRYFYSKKLMAGPYDKEVTQRLFISIMANSVLWAVMINLLLYENKLTGLASFLGITIASAFSVGSSSSLAPSKWLGFFVQSALLIPMVTLGFILAYFEGNSAGWPLGAFMLVALFYSLKQVKFIRLDLTAAIQFEDSLIKANRELEESRQLLAEETAKNIHSSRLASLGEMAGGIAHEVNNPLMVMQGHAQHIKRTMDGELTETTRTTVNERVDKLLKAVARVAQIVKGLRQFSQQGESLPFEKVRLHQVIRDTLDFCQEKLKNNNVVLRVEVPEEIMIQCRPVQVSQVLINLINNSFDAIHDLPEKWIEIKATIVAANAVIQVTDCGKGLPKEVEAKLFQPFFTSKGVGKGTGLGLSISKGILKEHNGDIYYDNAKAHTTFFLVIPIVDRRAA